MKIGTNEELPKEKKKSTMMFIVGALICGVVVAMLFQGAGKLIAISMVLLIKYWMYVLGGIGALLLIRKIFFRRRVQEMRVVR